MSKLGAAAFALAVAAVLVSGIVGVQTQTAPGKLACEFFAMSASETSHTRSIPIEAAQAFAVGMRDMDRPIPTFRGGDRRDGFSGTCRRQTPPDGRVFAVRNHGQTVALLFVLQGPGGWDVRRTYAC